MGPGCRKECHLRCDKCIAKTCEGQCILNANLMFLPKCMCNKETETFAQKVNSNKFVDAITKEEIKTYLETCLLYTSDAADE